MARTAGDVGVPNSQGRWPPPGWCVATCVNAEKWKSPKKSTPAVMLTWRTPDDQFEWEDPVFVTGKALKRLNLVALRVCGMPRDTVLPDDDLVAAKLVANYIMEHVVGQPAKVQIEVHEEEFMYETGPKAGQVGKVQRSKVAFGGYDVATSNDLAEATPGDTDGDSWDETIPGKPDDVEPPPEGPAEGDDIPF